MTSTLLFSGPPFRLKYPPIPFPGLILEALNVKMPMML